MRSARHYRECAARLRSLANLEFNPALREQLEIVAHDYDEIADEIEQKAVAPGSRDRTCGSPRGIAGNRDPWWKAAGVRGVATRR